jgi:hypothetical protein
LIKHSGSGKKIGASELKSSPSSSIGSPIANALTAVLQPMVASITVAPAVQAVPAAPGLPGPVTFAHTLGQAWADLLNYKLPGDAKIYSSAMAKLVTTFSLVKPNVTILLAKLGDCSNSASWTTTLHIGIGAVPAVAGIAVIPAIHTYGPFSRV